MDMSDVADPAEDAVATLRKLAEIDATRQPELAAALDDLADVRTQAGHPEHALSAAEEAVTIHRTLAGADPGAHLRGLAASLNNLGALQTRLDHHEPAVSAAGEAVELLRRLAADQPDAYLRDLALTLNNLGSALARQGRRKEALAASKEAIGIYRGLAEIDPETYLPGVATSLWAYAWVCVSLRANLPGALQSVNEAISILTGLAERTPEVFTEPLFRAYRTLADILDGLGRTDEAAELRGKVSA
jgi:tetratricopeptide (TPR) repeat protein